MKLEWTRSRNKGMVGDWNLWRVVGDDDNVDLMGWVTPQAVVTYRVPITRGLKEKWPEASGFTTVDEAKAWLVATISMDWSDHET